MIKRIALIVKRLVDQKLIAFLLSGLVGSYFACSIFWICAVTPDLKSWIKMLQFDGGRFL